MDSNDHEMAPPEPVNEDASMDDLSQAEDGAEATTMLAMGEAEELETVQGRDDPATDTEGDVPDGDQDVGSDGQDDEENPGSAVTSFSGHDGAAVFCVASHPTNNVLVASGGEDDKAYVWDAVTGNIALRAEGHTDSVTVIGFSTDGKYLATGGLDGLVKTWDVDTGEMVSSLDGPAESVEWISWHPRGNVLAAGDGDGSVWLWNPTKGPSSAECTMCVFGGHTGIVHCGAFSGDGKRIVSASEDGTLRVWSPKTGLCDHNFSEAHDDAILSLACSSSSPLVLTGSGDCTAKIFNIDTNREMVTLNGHTEPVECVAFCSPDHPFVVTGGLDGKVNVWDINTGNLRHSLSHAGAVVRTAVLPSPHCLAVTCSADRTTKAWDYRTGELVYDWDGPKDTVLDVTFTADQRRVVVGSDDGKARVFELTE